MDLTEFKSPDGKKIVWAERLKIIHKQFPSVGGLDWRKSFSADPTLAGRIIGDIIKADLAEPGRPGKRAAVDRHLAEQRLRELLGEDYTMSPFNEAFKVLTKGKSIRAVAAKTGIDRNQVYRLLEGKATPDAWAMEQIAKAFNKQPGYFLEYRVAYVTAFVTSQLLDSPESSVFFFRKLTKGGVV
jgi:transcriptional regulator with XRE-family HTH domain